LPYLKTISQPIETLPKLKIIAETCNSALRTGSDDITGFKQVENLWYIDIMFES